MEAVAVKNHPIPPFFYKPKSRVGSWGSRICSFAVTEKMISSKTLQHLLASPISDGTKRYWRSCYSWWAGWYRDVGASDCLCYTWTSKIRPSRLAPAGFPHPAEMTLGQKLLWADSSELGHGGCAPQECFWRSVPQERMLLTEGSADPTLTVLPGARERNCVPL